MAAHHPAPFSAEIMQTLKGVTADWQGPILDPYAGIGRVHDLGRDDTYGIEIEEEWAKAHERTYWASSASCRPVGGYLSDKVFAITERKAGVAVKLPRPRAIITSPDYGNRFADTYLGTPGERQKRDADGSFPRRRSYAISLGRSLSNGSTSKLKFGPAYKSGHIQIFRFVTAICLPHARLALNVSDYYADRQRVPVTRFWIQNIGSLGWRIDDVIPVETHRYRDGANSELRVETESVIVATLT